MLLMFPYTVPAANPVRTSILNANILAFEVSVGGHVAISTMGGLRTALHNNDE